MDIDYSCKGRDFVYNASMDIAVYVSAGYNAGQERRELRKSRV